ncbi:polysaccharide pyruvyl transferase family protein [Brevibacterium aurantiacum]|uniref:Polysaccharide pyruvyl transferase family protein WcaK n=1 Tax=Brevibacterium aurantiacum TaxID=273384 RepID=A0A2H1K6S3_BREAU|nr:polysaccharide pyruvyl transferase family protein [Brevibacterium aurantiacum]GEB23689.1 hypothetical protein BAU01nite_24220 [Brevibacterium aurantiacum]SMX95497.1 Polysaccharide pyruvyl transferase family protein WcaK [Brevibacterium aurantiacum]
MPNLKLFHFDIPTWGNYGDKALFPVVRDAFRVLGASDDAVGTHVVSGRAPGRASDSSTVDQVDFTSAAALRREVDTALIERINARADAVVIGGGGLFLQDTNPNRASGWQWKISAEALAAIKVPLIVYALGDNRFPGQPEFDELMRTHVSQVLDQSVFFGLRNTGSIETMSRFLGVDQTAGHTSESEGSQVGRLSQSGPIRFQPCPTTIAGLLYEPLIGRRPDPRQKVLAIQMLVHPRQIAAGFDAEVIHQATIDAARMLVAGGWRVLSTPFHPDDAEVSRQLVAEVPEVEEVRLYGPGVGFFAGFELFSSIPYVLGGRGHAQMIPFGVGSIPISLDLHAKLGYFAHDIGHPEFIVPVAPEGMTVDDVDSYSDSTGDDTDGNDTYSANQRARALAQRIVDTIEQAYAQGNDLQDDLASIRQNFLDITRENHLEIHDALHPGSGAGSLRTYAPRAATDAVRRTDGHLRTETDIYTEEFHLAAVAEAEGFSTAQTRELSKVRREHRQELENSASLRRQLDDERENLLTELKQKTTRLEQKSMDLDTQTTETNRQADEAIRLQRKLEESSVQLRSVNDRTAIAEAKVLIGKTAHGLKWRARRLRRMFSR